MVKKISLLLLALSFCRFSNAQFDLSGVVTTNDGKKIEHAVVTLKESLFRNFSDEKGRFTFYNLKPGKYTLQVYQLGYHEYSSEINLTSNQHIEVLLFKKAFVTDEVIIQSSRMKSKIPIAQNSLNKNEIEAMNSGKDVPSIMDQLTGVVVSSDAGAGIGYTGIRVRGSDATRINFTINGIPINDAESQSMYWVDMPDLLSSTNQIQVQRGVGTSVNGAGSFGASINILTDHLSEQPYAETNLSYGTFNTKKVNLLAGTGLLKNSFAFETRLSSIKSDGYVDRATSDLKSFYFSGGYFGKKSMLKAVIFSGIEKTYQSWYGVPESRYKNDKQGMMDYIYRNGLDTEDATNLLESGRKYNYYLYPGQTDNYQQDNYQLHFSHQINNLFTLNVAAHMTRGKGYYEEFKKNAKFSDYGLPSLQIQDTVITKTNLVRRKWLDNYFYGMIYSLTYENKNIEIKTGGGINQYDGDHYGKIVKGDYIPIASENYTYYQNNGLKNNLNHWIKGTLNMSEHFIVYADMQYRYVHYRFTGFDDFAKTANQVAEFHFFNPKAGVTFLRNENESGWLSFAIGNKEPSRDDFTESTSISRPKRENLIDFEAGYSIRIKKTKFSINAYYMQYNDQLILTGKINDVGNYTRQNVKNSYRRGLEAECNFNAGRILSISGNVTLSENKILNYMEFVDQYDADFNYIGQQEITYNKTNIAFSPSIVAAAGIELKPLKKLSIKLTEKYVGKQYLDNTSSEDKSLKAFAYTNISAHYTFKIFKSIETEAGVSVFNLFNEMYSSNGYTYGYLYDGLKVNENFYYPQAGTHTMISAKFRF
jgi:iron complex outermembrane receptor protein